MNPIQEFQLEQYRALRTEINNNIAEIRALQRFAVVGVAAVWAWIAVNAASAPKWAAFTPLIFVILGALHSRRVLRELRSQGDYIAMVIEPSFAGEPNVTQMGWENWIRRIPESARRFKTTAAATADEAAVDGVSHHNPAAASAPISVEWVVLSVLILLVGIVQAVHPHAVPEPKTTVVCCTGGHC